jgi:thiol-disulfide isomerase/thioredoxin
MRASTIRPTPARPPVRSIAGALVLAVVAALACAGGSGTVTPEARTSGTAAEEEPVLAGVTTREAIEEAEPLWVARTVEAEVDAGAAAALAAVPPGAEITVFLGTWCGDSRREVPRFWKALDQVGGLVPFDVEYVAVDREKEEPADRTGPADLRYVPTFIVRRDGDEVGRVVESSPNGIERDLLALLTGEASGILTLRDDL